MYTILGWGCYEIAQNKNLKKLTLEHLLAQLGIYKQSIIEDFGADQLEGGDQDGNGADENNFYGVEYGFEDFDSGQEVPVFIV